MSTYLITGPYPVLGKQPGDTLTSDELDGWDTDWLTDSGHIVAQGDAAATTTEAAPAEATTSEADPAANTKED